MTQQHLMLFYLNITIGFIVRHVYSHVVMKVFFLIFFHAVPFILLDNKERAESYFSETDLKTKQTKEDTSH